MSLKKNSSTIGCLDRLGMRVLTAVFQILPMAAFGAPPLSRYRPGKKKFRPSNRLSLEAN